MKMIAAISAVMLSATLTSAPARGQGLPQGRHRGRGGRAIMRAITALGAAAGCLIGRHEAAQREREQERARQQQGASDYQADRPDYR